jgi:hypothetical protein
MLRRLAFGILFSAFAIPPFAMGQGACAELGVNCSHSTTQQRPSDDGNNRSSSGSRAERESAADSYTDAGYDHMKLAASPAHFFAAENSFRAALENVTDYGPAELGLCQLYGHHAERYEEALAACKIASRSRGFAHGRQTRKWITGTLMVELNLNRRLKAHAAGVQEWNKICVLTTDRSQNGSTVDPSANSSQFLAACATWTKNLDAELAKLNIEVSAYNAKQQ